MRKVKELARGHSWKKLDQGSKPAMPVAKARVLTLPAPPHLETARELNQNWAHSPLPQIQGFTANGIPAPSPPHTPLLWSPHSGAQLSLTGSPTGQVGHLGVPRAQQGPRGNEAKGKCLLAPSLSHAGAMGSFGAAVAMQPCLFRKSLAEAGSMFAAGPGACSVA